MGTRLELHELLKTITPQVYFQSPSSIQMIYPCIRYNLSDENVLHADNNLYKHETRYQVTLIHPNPDNTERRQIINLPKCRFDRFFTKDDLNHYVYELYF